jgi:hypothetical protein
VGLLTALVVVTACSGGGGGSGNPPAASNPLVVDTLLDENDAPVGTLSLREALDNAGSGQPISFDPMLDGGTIELSIVGEAHSILKGEVMGIRDEPSGPVSYLVGYFDRDYGRSALYARKNVVIDASSLPSGITIAWMGGAADPARVLAVYGDLTLRNVSVTGGVNIAEDISTGDPDDQPSKGISIRPVIVVRLVGVCTQITSTWNAVLSAATRFSVAAQQAAGCFPLAAQTLRARFPASRSHP